MEFFLFLRISAIGVSLTAGFFIAWFIFDKITDFIN
jgi:hypothetical protein